MSGHPAWPPHAAGQPAPAALEKGISDLLDDWETTGRKAADGHSAACDHYEHVDSFYGVLSTALTAVVGSALFATLQHTSGTASRVAFGSIGVVAAILSGIQTTAKYGQRAERHRQASRQYAAATRQIDELRALPPEGPALQARLDAIRKLFDDTGALAPNVPPRIWNGGPTLWERLTRQAARRADPPAEDSHT